MESGNKTKGQRRTEGRLDLKIVSVAAPSAMVYVLLNGRLVVGPFADMASTFTYLY